MKRPSFSDINTPDFRARFEAFLLPVDDNGCRISTANPKAKYAQLCVRHGLQPITAHVAAWSLANGRLPLAGMHICHTCDLSRCCEPGHLVEDTQTQNNRDLRDRKRAGGWIDVKLAPADVIQVYDLAKGGAMSQRAIAREYGIHQTAVWDVLHGRSWSDLTGVSR